MTTHSCSFCDYTTPRWFNLDRHIRTRHVEKGCTTTEKGCTSTENGCTSTEKGCTLNSIHDNGATKSYVCVKCERSFHCDYYLKVHKETCNGVRKNHCEKCNQQFANKHSLCRHRKVCKGETAISVNAPIVNNITTTNNNNVTNNNNNNITVVNTINSPTINVLTFPDDDDGTFDFVTSNITQAIMKKCVSSYKAEVGFNRFMGAILQHPENKFVMKSNPNVNYSKIHVGDGKWILAPDGDVYPIMTHHMTTAAIAKLNEFKKSLKFMCDSFQSYVNTINTDDECKQYQDTIQRLKLMVVNMTKEIESAEKDTRALAT